MGDPVTKQVMKFYEERDKRFFDQESLNSFAYEKYMIRKQQM